MREIPLQRPPAQLDLVAVCSNETSCRPLRVSSVVVRRSPALPGSRYTAQHTRSRVRRMEGGRWRHPQARMSQQCRTDDDRRQPTEAGSGSLAAPTLARHEHGAWGDGRRGALARGRPGGSGWLRPTQGQARDLPVHALRAQPARPVRLQAGARGPARRAASQKRQPGPAGHRHDPRQREAGRSLDVWLPPRGGERGRVERAAPAPCPPGGPHLPGRVPADQRDQPRPRQDLPVHRLQNRGAREHGLLA